MTKKPTEGLDLESIVRRLALQLDSELGAENSLRLSAGFLAGYGLISLTDEEAAYVMSLIADEIAQDEANRAAARKLAFEQWGLRD